MTNLIPPEAKKTVLLEYWVRVVTTWGFLLSLAFFSISALLVPTYVLVDARLKALNEEVAQTDEADVVFLQAEDVVSKANALARQLDEQTQLVEASSIFDEIDRRRGNEVVIRNYLVSYEADSISGIQLQGTADSRESLAQFKQDLERSPMFETATVPISDLARDEHLPFAVTLTLSAHTIKP